MCASEFERTEWLESIRNVCANNVDLSHEFHPGIYKGIWTCCKSKEKHASGCKKTYFASLSDCKASEEDCDRPEVKNKTADTFVVVALYDFEANEPDELGLDKGHKYTVVDDTYEPWWWYATNSSGKEGLIPSNYVERIEHIQCYDNMSREQAEEALNNEHIQDGTFLLRASNRSTSHPYSLSLK